MPADADRIDTIVRLCRARGLVYPSGEIYGGVRAAWDYGPLGVELKENVKRQWWKAVVHGRDDVVGLDTSVILPREVWAASGHVEEFVALLVQCTACHHRFPAAELVEEYRARTGEELDERALLALTCPDCGSRGRFTQPSLSSGMLATRLGPDEADDSPYHLRPETAQGAFVNFHSVQATGRRRPPFGVGQIGKVFRNEVTPGDFLFRSREFELMELAYFVPPDQDEHWHRYWIDARTDWYTGLGVDRQNLRHYPHPADHLAHYSRRTVDVEYRFGFPGREWDELEGIANRGDFDLDAHAERTGVDLSYYDRAAGSRYRPFVIGPSVGVGRAVLAFLLDAYTEEETPNPIGGVDRRVVLRLDRRLAPVKVGVLPVSRSPDLAPQAAAVTAELRRSWNVEFDDSGAIGRRYRRQDEIGTPFCVTVDFDGLLDHAVTVRDRDSLVQERVSLDKLNDYLAFRLRGC
ncbi:MULTISPECIES: glycine--tRNA ligase [Actinoalloteichus]|uniref:Glycyl-tRNA synthetase n=1 Tax=Actinoalloteichus fjordicus TaxID=1612552 RepID=A0AAC9LHB2_9PSEU|nr:MULTISPECIES: glycine--tRNA ligase [Actinoalloteichus]APU16890.1 glycyl-tRNA synthetase [Actinoalloteichus fjordicus]APU22970.1 glycyl-tRNA synthetase [Actinoalloteichus sp. GBA129-24]